jgi:hypothetical protein
MTQIPGPSKIRESDLTGREGGIVVRVDILSHDDTNARVRVEDSGIQVRQGQQYTAPISALIHVADYSY